MKCELLVRSPLRNSAPSESISSSDDDFYIRSYNHSQHNNYSVLSLLHTVSSAHCSFIVYIHVKYVDNKYSMRMYNVIMRQIIMVSTVVVYTYMIVRLVELLTSQTSSVRKAWLHNFR